MARGSVQKRGKSWSIVFDLGKDAEGNRHQKREGGFRTRKEADAALTARQREIDTGSALDPTKLTVAELVERYLEVTAADRRPTSDELYRRWVRLHIVPHVGAVPVQKLTEAHVATLAATLRGAGICVDYQKRVVGLLRAALDRALGWRMVGRNVAHGRVVAGREATRIPAHWDGATARRFLALVADEPAAAPYTFALATGLRRGELAALRWADVDLDRALVLVHRNRVRYKGQNLEHATKSGKPRTVDLDPDTVALLRRHRRRQAEMQLRHGTNWRDEGYVFCLPPYNQHGVVLAGGRPVALDTLNRKFEKLVARLGLPPLTLHGLRHTHATILLIQGVHPKMVQERLGHASFTITMNTYSHIVPGLGRQAADAVGRALFAPEPVPKRGTRD